MNPSEIIPVPGVMFLQWEDFVKRIESFMDHEISLTSKSQSLELDGKLIHWRDDHEDLFVITIQLIGKSKIQTLVVKASVCYIAASANVIRIVTDNGVIEIVDNTTVVRI